MNHQIRFHRGIAIPDGMLSPGQDGYRTPTIEDYEQHLHRRGHHGAFSQMHLRSPGGILSLSSETKSHLSLTRGLEIIGWKERLRHFTWSFFTMTMATGGIANVLHTGQAASINLATVR